MKIFFISIMMLSLLSACSRKVDRDISHNPGTIPHELRLTLNDTQIKLANVTTQKVKSSVSGQMLSVNAQLVINEELTELISSRAPGRVVKLYFKESGKEVKKGEALYELYSENLLTLQKEYLLAKIQYERLSSELRYKSFYEAAKKKLLLYGLSKQQVSNLNEQNLKDHITFLSPVSGIIREINTNEGSYVDEGSLLYKIENNTNLWVETELYAKEADYLKRGDKIMVQTAGFEKALEATISFLSPELRSGTQVMIVRATLPNPTLRLKPGQSAQVLLQHSSRESIAIPTDAVIRGERGTHVYVQTDANTFVPRVVQTGIENFDSIEITSGLKTDELVVVTGAYLLYSEFFLKKGLDPMMIYSAH